MARVNTDGVHLVVLQHGLWGCADNLAALEAAVSKAADERGADNVVILNCRASEGDGTYMGVDSCGDKLVGAITQRVCDLTHEGRPVTHITLIGYSMGGLIARYAAGKLWAMGWLGPGSSSSGGGSKTSSASSPNSDPHPEPTTLSATTQHQPDQPQPAQPDQHKRQQQQGNGSLEAVTGGPSKLRQQGLALAAEHGVKLPLIPVTLATITTPHLGSWQLPLGFKSRLINSLVPHLTGRTGSQLMLLDAHTRANARPLLMALSDPRLPFMPALAAFKHRILMANVRHDRTVPYLTAAIKLSSPYDTSRPVTVNPAFPSIVRPATPPPGQLPADMDIFPHTNQRQSAPHTGGGTRGGSDVGGGAGAGCRGVTPPLITPGATVSAEAVASSDSSNSSESSDSSNSNNSNNSTAAEAAGANTGAQDSASSPGLPASSLQGGGQHGSAAGADACNGSADNFRDLVGMEAKGDGNIEGAVQGVVEGQVVALGALSEVVEQRRVLGGCRYAIFISLSLLLLPLSLTLLGYMIHVSRKKSIKAAASPVDTSWLDDYTPSPSPSPTPSSAADLRPSKPSTPASSPPASPAPPLPPPPLPVGHTVVVRDAAPLVANHNEAEAVSIQEDVDQGVELLVPRSSRDEAGAGGGSGSDSSSSDVNGVEGGDGGLMAEDVEVTVDGGPTMHVHAGVVTSPGGMRDAQIAMAAALNSLGWEKIDVDVCHYHAHAAVVCRGDAQAKKPRFSHCNDVMPYLVSRLPL